MVGLNQVLVDLKTILSGKS